MHRRYLFVLVSFAFLALAPVFTYAQDSLDLSMPSSFPMANVQAYNSSYGTINVWGPIDILNYYIGTYVAIPTSAPAGDKLAYFQDENATGILFRNNTLMLPEDNHTANFLLATGDLVSDGTRFYGQVTGLELDTQALDGDGASAVAILYLNELPNRASYGISLTDDEAVKKAVMDEVSKAGQPGSIKLMLGVFGKNQEAQSSIGYTIIRMKADGPGPDGNVTAYRYYNGAVTMLPCRTITTAEGPVYETMYAGAGTFAFIGPFSPPRGSYTLMDVLIFSVIIAALLIVLAALVARVLARRR